jgi:hypothetical protein
MSICTLAGVTAGVLMRGLASSFRLWIVDVRGKGRPAPGFPAGAVDGNQDTAALLALAGSQSIRMLVRPGLALSPAVADP